MSASHLIFLVLFGLMYLCYSAMQRGDRVALIVHFACCAALGDLYSKVAL